MSVNVVAVSPLVVGQQNTSNSTTSSSKVRLILFSVCVTIYLNSWPFGYLQVTIDLPTDKIYNTKTDLHKLLIFHNRHLLIAQILSFHSNERVSRETLLDKQTMHPSFTHKCIKCPLKFRTCSLVNSLEFVTSRLRLLNWLTMRYTGHDITDCTSRSSLSF